MITANRCLDLTAERGRYASCLVLSRPRCSAAVAPWRSDEGPFFAGLESQRKPSTATRSFCRQPGNQCGVCFTTRCGSSMDCIERSCAVPPRTPNADRGALRCFLSLLRALQDTGTHLTNDGTLLEEMQRCQSIRACIGLALTDTYCDNEKVSARLACTEEMFRQFKWAEVCSKKLKSNGFNPASDLAVVAICGTMVLPCLFRGSAMVQAIRPISSNISSCHTSVSRRQSVGRAPLISPLAN